MAAHTYLDGVAKLMRGMDCGLVCCDACPVLVGGAGAGAVAQPLGDPDAGHWVGGVDGRPIGLDGQDASIPTEGDLR